MLIAVQDGLTSVKNYLKSKGYQVVDISENVKADSYIYSEGNTNLVEFSDSITPCLSGGLIINADGISLSEIEHILQHRTYSPLFY